MVLTQALELFLFYKEGQGVAVKTYASYDQHIRKFIEFTEVTETDAVTPLHIVKFLSAQRNVVSVSTVRGRYRALRVFFNWAVTYDVVSVSPLLKLPIPKAPTIEPRVAQTEDLQRLLASIGGDSWCDLRDVAIIRLLMDTGMRAGELANLRVVDVDVTERLLRIRAGKDKEDRRAPFTDVTKRALTFYLMNRPPAPVDAEYLFLGATTSGGPVRGRLTAGGVAQMMERRCVMADVVYINPHSVRHWFATKALNDGVRVEVVSKVLGHYSVDFTLKTYARLLTETVRREYNQHWHSV